MSVAWLFPGALFGLALAALPIVIHLLARHRARTQPFPSLRFVRHTQLAAMRRRSIDDLALLVCRVAIVTLAALALAGPVTQSASRLAAQAARVSRAVVVVGAIAPDRLAALQADAYRSKVFRRAVAADAVAEAVPWLDQQAASAREVVFAGVLQRGAVTAGDVQRIPANIGIRFEPVTIPVPADVTVSVLAQRDGSLVRVNRLSHLTDDATRVVDEETESLPSDQVSILAKDQRLAAAALNAALDAGVPWRDFSTKVVIAWEDADAAAVARAAAGGATMVAMAVPQPASASADAVMRELLRVSPPELTDPAPIGDEQLRQWSRAPGLPNPAAPLADEGDRRWLWLAVLMLLAIEWWLRRPGGTANVAVTPHDEVRVA